VNQPLTSLVRQEAKSPVVWTALLAATIAWPIALGLSPLSTTLGSANARDIAYDVAFLLALLGALYSDRKFTSAGWLLSRASSAKRDVLSVVVVGLGALVPALLSLSPLVFLQGVSTSPALGNMALISFHMAALALCLRSLGFSYSERSVALAFFALALPASMSKAAGPLNTLLRVLDPSAGGPAGDANLLLTSHHVGSIIGLTLFAQLVGIRSTRQR